jgi:hypothetical protein
MMATAILAVTIPTRENRECECGGQSRPLLLLIGVTHGDEAGERPQASPPAPVLAFLGPLECRVGLTLRRGRPLMHGVVAPSAPSKPDARLHRAFAVG